MSKFFKTLFLLALIGFSKQAFSQSYSISFTFPSGGTGLISFDYPTTCTNCLMNQMTNFSANFQIGGNTWTQADMTLPAVISPTTTTYLEYGVATGWYVDDTTAPVAGTPLLTFTNGGGNTLTFDMGSAGPPINKGLAIINGAPIVGNFIAINTPVNVPTLSQWFLVLLITGLAITGFAFSRNKRQAIRV